MSPAKRRAARGPQSGSLAIPELLRGDWKVALIVTYGAELGFFESHLATQLHRIPVRLILADDTMLEKTFTAAAQSGQRLSQANRTYAVAPVRNPAAAHAKAILLADSDRGMLLTGSGNLSLDGYAGDGELWRRHTYAVEQPDHLEEFATVRSLIDGIISRGWTDPDVATVVTRAWQYAPWIPSAAPSAHLVHNLERPLIDAISDAVTSPVTSLTIHAPFHDKDSAALGELIRRLKPKHLRVLLTASTSADPAALAKAVTTVPDVTFIEVAVEAHPPTYLHAKWIHAQGPDQDTLISGSANISRAALLHTATTGNIELAHIETRAPGGFDALYDHLTQNLLSSPADLQLTYREPGHPEPHDGPLLLWSRLEGSALTLTFAAPTEAPALRIANADDVALATTKTTQDGAAWSCSIAKASLEALNRHGPLHITLTDDPDEAPLTTWPYRVDEFTARMARISSNRMLAKVAKLPQTDAELRLILEQLEDTLLFDPISTWRVAPVKDADTDTSDDGVHMRLEDIDWERLRRHARHGAYRQGTLAGVEPTDIQVILSAITAQIAGLGEDPPAGDGSSSSQDDDDLGDETDQNVLEGDDDPDEDDESPEGSESPGLSVATRTRMAFNRFLKRYSRALGSREFQEALGPVISATNATIFNHLMSELLQKELVDPDTCITAQVALWRHLWGGPDQPGLHATLDEETAAAVADRLEQSHVRATTLRAIAKVAPMVRAIETGPELREQVRHLVTNADWDLNMSLLAEAAKTRQEQAVIVEALLACVSWMTVDEHRDCVLNTLGVTDSNAAITKQVVLRQGRGEEVVHEFRVTVPVPGLTAELAAEALRQHRFACRLDDEPDDYWRIRFAGNGSDVAFWDDVAGDGAIRCGGDVHELSLEDTEPDWPEWLLKLEELQSQLPSGVPRVAAAS